MQVTLTTLAGEAIEKFYDEIPVRLAGPPTYDNESLVNGWRVSRSFYYQYDINHLEFISDSNINDTL